MRKFIYFDNAATSWPKPPGVSRAMTDFLEKIGASPGHSSHSLALAASRIVYETREKLAELFKAKHSLRIVFSQNATEALNLALEGILRAGDHLIISSMEHNSVMRPLRALEKKGLELTVVQCSNQGFLTPSDLERVIKPNTRMIALIQASNVVGSILPITEAGEIARKNNLLFLVDAGQTAGVYPIDVEAQKIDFLAFTGHKSLLGPQGTGGLYIGERVNLKEFKPLKSGGTGSGSESEEQPEFLPDKYESGTLNAVGIAGLLAGLNFVLEKGVEEIRRQEMELTKMLIDGLSDVPGLTIYGSQNVNCQTAIVSFNIEGMEASEVGLRLDEQYGILSRVGLHCSPAAHKTIGTFPSGTIRFSLGYFNTEEEVERAIKGVRKIRRNL